MAKSEESPVCPGLQTVYCLSKRNQIGKNEIKLFLFLQRVCNLSKWINPLWNDKMKGVKYPGSVIWSWTEGKEGEMVPSLSWKCSM